MVKDMTQGSPAKLILSFSLPILVGNLFQQFYNMADSMIVGQFIGKDAFAAVGATGSVSFLIIGFVLGLASGLCIPVSQCFGAGDRQGLRRCVANILWLGVAIAAALTTLMMFTTRGLLTWMDTPENIFSDSFTYISIIFAGIPACLFYNTTAGLLRAIGDSRTPLYFLIISSVLNIGLDLLFILVFHMGVEGAALATVASQLVSGILCLIWIIKKFPILHPKKEDLPLDLHIAGRLLSIGLPMAFQFSITAIGSIILQTAVNSLGSDIIASMTAAMKVQNIVVAPMETLGLTMATYCGQNLGACRIDRIRSGMRQCTLMSMVLCVVSFVFVYFCGRYVALLYIKKEEVEILARAAEYLTINGCFYPVLGLIFIYRNGIQGMGYGVPAMAAGLFELAARSGTAIFFVRQYGYRAVCFASPLAWIAADVLLLPVYFIVIHKLQKRIPPHAETPQSV